MRLRRGVEVGRALLWLASGRFLVSVGRVVPSKFVERRTPDPVYWNVWAAAPAALVAELRFASSSLQQHGRL